MKNNRRNFLKLTSIAGLGVVGAGMLESFKNTPANPFEANPPGFNMSGYAAPKLETVRIGFIGLGNRGIRAVDRIPHIEGVKINAICDVRADKVDAANKVLEKAGQNPDSYNGGKEEWKKVCERKDIDLIYITTPWELHTPMAIYAMNHGKHVCVEVPAATTVDECWQLVETSEKTKKHCMMLENCCYDFFELLTLNMARQGMFGEIIHCEGAYLHDLLNENFSKSYYAEFWRLKENYTHKGNLYPTHGLGPVCQVLNINRGDQMDYLVSMSGNDFMMNEKAKSLAKTDALYSQFVGKSYNGNMNTTTIRTKKGKTIMLQHDVTSPRPYSRIHLISGTKGIAQKFPLPGKISFGHDEWAGAEEMARLEKQFTPPIVAKIGEMAKRIGGHGGMDLIMDWRTIDCLRNGLPLDQDVYDAALWSAIWPLSEKSLASRSNSVNVPDFTRGAWKSNTPIDLSLSKGGTTKVI